MSLLGFFFAPGLDGLAHSVGTFAGRASVSSAFHTELVVIVSAALGTVMMLGVLWTLPTNHAAQVINQPAPPTSTPGNTCLLYWLNGVVMFALAGFELGIVLQGQQAVQLSAGQSSHPAAIMFAECSLVMLGINADCSSRPVWIKFHHAY